MHAMDAHLLAFFQIATPRGRVLEREMADRHILAIGEAKQRRADEGLLVNGQRLSSKL